MILVDNISKNILELSWGKLTSVKGDRDQIIAVIQKRYMLLSPVINTYVNYVPCFKKIDKQRALQIVSIIHKKIFIVDSSLLKLLKPAQIVWRLLWFNSGLLAKIHQEHDIVLYGEANIPDYSKVKIKTKDDLKKYCIYTTPYKEWAMWKSNSAITLEWFYDWNNLHVISDSSWSGTSSSKSIAIKKSVSEVLERFSAGIVPDKASANKLPLNDKLIQLFMWNRRLKEEDRVFPITHLVSKQKYSSPWNLLFYPYLLDQSRNASSNGMSCHITKTLAIENGLFELIERDAYVLSRLLKSWIHRIEKNKKVEKLIEKLNLQKHDVQLFVIHFDNPIPVVLSVIRDGQKISTSLGIGYDIEYAMHKSLSESSQFSLRNIELDPELKPTDDLIQMHLKHYVKEENFYKVAWFYEVPSLSITQAKDLFQPIKNSKELIAYYDSIWTNLYSYQYENPILTYYKRYCMRVISDNLLHIWFWENVPSSILNSERLKLRKEKLSVQSLNTEIHPFG